MSGGHPANLRVPLIVCRRRRKPKLVYDHFATALTIIGEACIHHNRERVEGHIVRLAIVRIGDQ